MGKLSALQVGAYAGRAGFTSAQIPIVVTIAFEESQFNTDAVGDKSLADAPGGKWGPSIGLMQVRSLQDPSKYSGADGMRVASKLSDPLYNMQVARAIYLEAGGKFTDWSTFQNRKSTSSQWSADNARINTELNNASLWQQFLAVKDVTAQQFWQITPGESFWAVPGSGGQSATSALGDTTTNIGNAASASADALTSLGSLASKVQDGNLWKRIGIGAGGYALILVGILFILVSAPAVRGALSTAGGAAVTLVPGGGVVKAAAKGVAKAGAKT